MGTALLEPETIKSEKREESEATEIIEQGYVAEDTEEGNAPQKKKPHIVAQYAPMFFYIIGMSFSFSFTARSHS